MANGDTAAGGIPMRIAPADAGHIAGVEFSPHNTRMVLSDRIKENGAGGFYIPREVPPSSTFAKTLGEADMQKLEERKAKDALLEKQMAEYKEYENRYNSEVQRKLPIGASIGNKQELKAFLRYHSLEKATPEEYAKWKAGYKTYADHRWFPENKELKNAGTIDQLGEAAGNISFAITEPVRKAIGLETDKSPHIRAQQAAANYETKTELGRLKEKAETEKLNDEELAYIEENDKGFFASLWEGAKSIPGLAETLMDDPDERREFLNNMIAYMPASMAVSGGMATAGNAVKNAAFLANNARKAKTVASRVNKAAESAEQAKKTTERWKQTQEGVELRNRLKASLTKNPNSLKSFFGDYAHESVAEALAEALIEAGQGGEFDLGAIGRNLGEDLGLEALPQTAIKTAKRILLDKGGVSKKEADAALGTGTAGFAKPGSTSGNIMQDIGTQGEGADRSVKKSIETLQARPEIKSEMKKLAELGNNGDFTAGEQYRFLDETPDDIKEAASKTKSYEKGDYDVAGFREDDISNITPIGNIGTIIHETLHGLEKHPQLAEDFAKWKADVKRWARENGREIPSDVELVAQTFAHRLGYPEPQAAKVKDIPVPDELLLKAEKAVGRSEEGARLRGDRFVHAKDDEQGEQENATRETPRRDYASEVANAASEDDQIRIFRQFLRENGPETDGIRKIFVDWLDGNPGEIDPGEPFPFEKYVSSYEEWAREYKLRDAKIAASAVEEGDLPFSLAGEKRFSLAEKPQEPQISMVESLRKMPRQERNAMVGIWNEAMNTEGKRKSETAGNADIKRVGTPSNRLNKAISQALGMEVKAREQIISLTQVRHINDRHGVGQEKRTDQTPVSMKEFALIPDVLANFDKVEKGRDTWNKEQNKYNQSVVITKAYSDGSIIVADAIIDNNVIEIKTMVVKKPTEVSPRNAEAPSGSLLSPSYPDLTEPKQSGLANKGTKSVTNNIQKKSGDGEENTRFSLIGEKGAAALDKAESKETRAENLRVAAKMEKAGEEAKNIWFATGWERGKDGKWRYEMPDIMIDESKLDGDYKYRGTLEDLAKNRELFLAYPELKAIKVEIRERPLPWLPLGLFDKENNELKVYWQTDYDKKQINSIVAHEIQHAIQTSEGFASGSTQEFFKNRQEPLNVNIEEAHRLNEEWLHSRTMKKFPEWLAGNISKISEPELKNFVKMFKNGEITREAFKENIDSFIQKYKEWKYEPDDMYYRTSGEVEARNVQSRMDIPIEKRSQQPPSETEGVEREKQIIVNDSKRAASMEEKAKLYQEGTDRQVAIVRLANLIKSNNNEPLVIRSKDGIEARLSKTSIGKLISNAAIQKSMDNGFTKEQHFAAVYDIDSLFRNSVKVSSRPDRNGDKNITIHRFAAPLFGNNAAYITVKETVQHGKRIYSAELMEIKKLGGMLEEARDKSPTHFPTPNSIHNIQKNPAGGQEKNVSREIIAAAGGLPLQI